MAEHAPDKATKQWELVLADAPAAIVGLEAELTMTQAQAVDDLIERSCWSDALPHLIGGQGNAEQRRDELRAAYRAERRPARDYDLSRLTLLERQLPEALQVSFPCIPKHEIEILEIVHRAMDAADAKAEGKPPRNIC